MGLQARTRVVAITQTLGETGGDRWLYTLEGEWARAGWSVTHLHLAGIARPDRPQPPPEVRQIRAAQGTSRLRSQLISLTRIVLQTVRSADAVILPPVGREVLPGYIAARVARRPVVVYSQGLARESLEMFERSSLVRTATARAIRRADAVLCVSPRSVRAAKELGVAPHKITEVRTGINLDEIRRRAGTAPTTNDPTKIVACGVIARHKGFDRIVDAVALLRDLSIIVHLTIVGTPGDAYSELVHHINQLGLQEFVTLDISGDDATPRIAASGALVHAARRESVGLVMLEALSLKRPVIAVDDEWGGARLVLDGGAFGALLPNGSPEALARAIRHHVDFPATLRRKALEAESYLRSDFSVAGAARASMRAIEDAIGEYRDTQ